MKPLTPTAVMKVAKSLSENRFEAKDCVFRRKCKSWEGGESQRDSLTEHGAAVAVKSAADARTRFSDRLLTRLVPGHEGVYLDVPHMKPMFA